jgi:general secretion pathway protein A
MYTSFYSLTSKPFQISSDPAFIWLGEKHKEALATLKYGILDDKGFLLLTGDVGTGKTTLINALISSLSDDVIFASVPDPRLEKLDFFNYIATSFGFDQDFSSKGTFLGVFTDFLYTTHEKNKKLLLIIDESQLLTQDLLEEIRLLSNINSENKQILNIFFVGQNEFNEIIERPENLAVSQRITLSYHLEPLSLEETEEYIRYRLKIAGTAKPIFEFSAIEEIHSYSEGIPRRINVICDSCLLAGYVKEKQTIDDSDVRDCIEEINIPEQRKENIYVTQDNWQFLDDFPESPLETLAIRPSEQRFEQKSPHRSRKTISIIFLVILALVLIPFLFSKRFIATYSGAAKYFASLGGTSTTEVLEKSAGNSELKQASETTLPEKSTNNDLPAVSEKTGSDENANGTVALSVKTEPSILPNSTESGISNQTTISITERPIEIQAQKLQEFSSKETLFVRFALDSNDFEVVDPEGVDRFVSFIKEHPSAIVELTGYTDSTGTKDYNLDLSKFRANIIKSFLLGKGVSPQQIKVQGLGDQNPIASNDTKEGRTKNRRVEIKIQR